MSRPSTHPPGTKSYAIDQIDDIERLREVAHRMWKAFFASHSQTAHLIAVLVGDEECRACADSLYGQQEKGCVEWEAWQRKVFDGFGSV